MAELYRKYRPTKFSEVVGQDAAIKMLKNLGKDDDLPHAFLLSGPSGTGKTTLARILKEKLGCVDSDFREINASDERGIDVIRMINKHVTLAPLGKSRIWLLDETHQLTGDAQNSFLKILEDAPKHAFFMLATTDPQKLKKTIITRCMQIKCNPLNPSDLKKTIQRVLDGEEKTLDDDVMDKIIECSEGSARKALVFLHSVLALDDKTDQMAVVSAGDHQEQSIKVARALMDKRTDWTTMREILKSVDEEPESLRRMVLGYCNTILLSKKESRAVDVIREFRDNWFDCGRSGLIEACWNVIHG